MKFPIPAAALLAVLLSSPAFAHEGHEKTHAPAYDAATAEQTPFGIAGDPKQVTRVIKLKMTDNMRFTPNRLTIREGDTVELSVSNRGKLLHEIVLGTAEGLQEHAEMMRAHPGMVHTAPQMLHVPAGKRGEIVWRFNKPGQFDFACLIAGHFEAGMKGSITVVPAVQAAK